MAIARDASSPARFNITGNGSGSESGTSGSFTPPNSSLLRLSVCVNSNGASPTFNLPTNTGTGVGTWALLKSQVNASGGTVAIYEAQVSTGSATTVSITISTVGTNTAAVDAAAWVDVWTGADSSQSGAATAGGTSATQNISPTISTTRTGSQVHGVAVDWNQRGTPTSTDTIDGYDVATFTSGGRAYKAANSGSPGSVAVNFNAAAASPQWCYALAEILAAATGSGARVSTFSNQPMIRGPM